MVVLETPGRADLAVGLLDGSVGSADQTAVAVGVVVGSASSAAADHFALGSAGSVRRTPLPLHPVAGSVAALAVVAGAR